LFAPNDRLQAEIAKGPTKQALKQLAVEAGMKTMLEDAIEKIRQGITTIEEVARVCYVEPDEPGRKIECPGCAKAIAEIEDICPFCQYRLKKTCEQCGAKLEDAWLLCPFCSARTPNAPETDRTAVATSATPIQSDIQTQKIRIVVADDEPPIRDMVKLLLETRGYQVIPAIDGEDALEKIRFELPDMAILDVVMPKRDGFSVCKAVRSSIETMFIPVVMLTGQDSIEEKLQGLSLGADDYITKPFNADELLARIETVLRRSYRETQ